MYGFLQLIYKIKKFTGTLKINSKVPATSRLRKGYAFNNTPDFIILIKSRSTDIYKQSCLPGLKIFSFHNFDNFLLHQINLASVFD